MVLLALGYALSVALLSVSAIPAGSRRARGDLLRRDDSGFVAAIAESDTPLVAMSGLLDMPFMSVAQGADPSQNYGANIYMVVYNEGNTAGVALGVQCEVGAEPGCSIIYQVIPSVPPALFPSPSVTFLDQVLLDFSMPDNKTVTFSITNMGTGNDFTQTFHLPSALPDLHLASWVVQPIGPQPYANFGTPDWVHTTATASDGSKVAPSDVTTKTEMMSECGEPLSRITIDGDALTIEYLAANGP